MIKLIIYTDTSMVQKSHIGHGGRGGQTKLLLKNKTRGGDERGRERKMLRKPVNTCTTSVQEAGTGGLLRV